LRAWAGRQPLFGRLVSVVIWPASWPSQIAVDSGSPEAGCAGGVTEALDRCHFAAAVLATTPAAIVASAAALPF